MSQRKLSREPHFFLDLEKGGQEKILRNLKKDLNISWEEMAELMEISRRMIFWYLKEESKVPLRRIQLVKEKKHLDISAYEDLKTKEMPNIGLKQIEEPAMSEEFAEFLGALSGDGCVCNTGYETSITCGLAVDYAYVTNRIVDLFIRLFAVRPKLRIEGTKIRCRIYSKKLKQFLSEKHDFPVGNRKNRTRIPKRILRSSKLLRCFLRGLFDTDGSFHGKRMNSGVVEYISCSKDFLKDIKNSLDSLGFSTCISGKSVYIYNQKQVEKFFRMIKPNNLKHITKYKLFKENGKVPSHKEIVKILRPWSSGRITAFQAVDPGSSPGGRKHHQTKKNAKNAS